MNKLFKVFVALAFILLLFGINNVFAATLSQNGEETYVNLPEHGTETLTLDGTIKTFKIYDNGGKSGHYFTGCNGGLILSAPEGYTININGTVNLSRAASAINDKDYLAVYDGTDDTANRLGIYRNTTLNDYLQDPVNCTSTGNKMFIILKDVESLVALDGLDATITLTQQAYTVTFKDYDGTVLKTQGNIGYGASATAPNDPTREGYTFTGWDKAFNNVTGDLEVTATYKINKFTVTFKDYNGTVLKVQENVEYGTSATAPSNPTREGYTFTGWNTGFSNVTSNLEVTAVYGINKYTVTFKDYDGTVLKVQNDVVYGFSATAPSNPTREGYIFSKWDKSFDKVKDNLVVTAVYREKTNQKGEVEKTTTENNVGNAAINNTGDELKNIIDLTQDEKNSIESGLNLFIYFDVQDISNTVSTEDKALINDVLTDGTEVGMYLDVNLFKQLEGENKIKITETNGKIIISFVIPENLRKEGRTFYMVRVHNGVPTILTSTCNGNTITFETDRFSTYALVYAEQVGEVNTNNSGNPKTGDSIMINVTLLGLSVIGLTVIGINRKKLFINK